MSTSTSSIFTGSSQFSQDFRNVITRATAIASLPISQLNNDKTNLTDQATALTGIDGKFQALQTAIEGIANALSGSALQADLSDDTKASVTLGTGAMEGNYSIDVINPGTYATSLSSGNWTAGNGATRNYQLSLGGVNYALSPTDNSAAAVVYSINSQYGDKVHATLVNVGSSSSPDYRISLQAAQLGDLTPGLLMGPSSPASLQTQNATGSNTPASSQTAQGWDDSPALTFQLSLNGQLHGLTPADNSATSVAEAINTQYGDQVTATVVNAGTDEAPDYRIQLTAAKPGDARPDILASDGTSDPVSLQTQQAAGSDLKSASMTARTWDGNTGPVPTYQLSFGGVKYDLSPTDNSAASVVSDINRKYGDRVTASVVDLGTGTSHDYRIRLTAVQAGDLKPDLVVSSVNLQTQQATGAQASYIVNNSGKQVASSTRSVTLATGVTATLLAADQGKPVNITVTRPSSALATALSSFTDAYNAAVDALDAQRGSAAGALAGSSVIAQLSRVLSGLSTYSPSNSSVSGLADLGLELDKTGHVTFSSLTLMSADLFNSTGVTSFLGSASKSGFLKFATDSLNGVESSTTGLITTARSSLKTQISDIDSRISDIQARVDQMTERMTAQMAAADALISSMEQQYNYLYGMFASMQTASKQYG